MINPFNILITVLLASSVIAETHLRAKRFGTQGHLVKPRTLRTKRQKGGDGLGGGLAGILQGLGDSLGDAGDGLGLSGIADPIFGTPTAVPVFPTQSPPPDASTTPPLTDSPDSPTQSDSTIPSGTGANPQDPTDAPPGHHAPDPTTTTTVSFTTTRGGGLIPTLSGILDPPPPTSTANPDPVPTNPPPGETEPSPPAQPTTSSDDGGILGPILNPPHTDTPPPPPATTAPPANTGTSNPAPPPPSTSSDDGGILGPILNPPHTNTPPPANTDTGTQPKPTSTSSDDGGILGPILGTPTNTDTGSQPTTTSSDDGGILGPILGTPTDTNTGPSVTTVPKPTDDPSSTGGGILSTILPVPPIDPGNDTTVSDSPTGTISTAFPSGSDSSLSSIFGSGGLNSTGIGSPSDSITSISPSIVTPVPTRSDDSAFQFVTETSLVLDTADTASATPSTSIPTDPDAPAKTATASAASDVDPAQAPSQAALPSDMPSRIFSTTSVDPNSPLLNGHSPISILFTAELNWPFVAGNNQTIGQLFRYMPVLISGALNIDINTVYTYDLQVSIPTGWQGDVNQLGTTYVMFIPTDMVQTLTSLMRTPNSAFYTQGGIPGQLANNIVPYSLVQVPPNQLTEGPAGSSDNNAANQSSKKRTDAIIGVCVGIGGVAALIGIWWLVKYWQRRQTHRHRRLSNMSDPNISNGIYGTQHDERRTSFFYAEDELRGGYEAAATEPEEGNMMTQRMRAQAAGHGPISAPVLQQNSLNW